MRSERAIQIVVIAVMAMAAMGCQRAPSATQQTGGGTQRPTEMSTQREQRERQTAWLQLDEAQRQRVRDAESAWAALSASEQAQMRTEFAQLDHSEQRGWLLGPQIGALWPQLSPLFSYVPEEERAPVLRILHEMNADELQALGRIAWRTPPEQRDALRKELIDVPAANRASWLAKASER